VEKENRKASGCDQIQGRGADRPRNSRFIHKHQVIERCFGNDQGNERKLGVTCSLPVYSS
jgi:hypothetical protein